MIKYRTIGNRIEEVTVTKETKCFVCLTDGCREAKRTDWMSYFDTREEAKQHLIQKAQGNVNSLQRRLDIAKGHLGNAKGL